MNRDTESPRASSGPRACKTCAASKARCIFTPEGSATNGKCGRCNRLNKECVMQTAAVRTRRRNQPSHVAQSEKNLGNLVLHPDVSQQLLTSRDTNDSIASQDSFSPIYAPQYLASASSSSKYGSTPPSYRSPSTTGITGSTKQPLRGLDLQDPEAILQLYLKEVAPEFPFVAIPPNTTAYSLSRNKPFLFKSIVMVVSAQDVKAQGAMAEEIVEYLSLHVLLRSEKTLDLAQGLLVFIGWFHAHIHLGRRMNALLQLSEALIIELGLNREPDVASSSLGNKRHAFWTFPDAIPGPGKRSLEERRAFLGLIYLSSILSLYVQSMEPLRYVKYTENCLEILRDVQEYPSDLYLVQLMKLQVITREINDALPRDSMGIALISGSTSLYIKNLQTKLNVFQERVPISLRENPFLLIHYHCILVYLTEIALYTPSLPSRVATLHACLSSIISLFSALFSVPILHYYKCIYPIWVQMIYSLGILSKLSLFESDDWDLSHVGRMADLSIVLEGMLGRLQEVVDLRRRFAGSQVSAPSSASSSGENEPGILGKVIPQLRQHKETFERRREEIRRRVTPVTALQAAFPVTAGTQTQFLTSVVSDMPFDTDVDYPPFDMSQLNFGQLDDAFWQDFIGDYN